MPTTRTLKFEAGFDVSGLVVTGLAAQDISLRLYRNGEHVDPAAVTFAVTGAESSTGELGELPAVAGFGYAVTFEIIGTAQVLHYPPERFHAARFVPDRRPGQIEGDFGIELYNNGDLSAAVLGFTEMGAFENLPAGGDYRIDLIPRVPGFSALRTKIPDSGQKHVENWEIPQPLTTSGVSPHVADIQDSIFHLAEDLNVLQYFEARRVDPYGDSVGEDAPSVPGPIVRFRGTLSSLKTEGAGELRSITTPTDFRARLGNPPDESIWVRQVTRLGEAIPGEIETVLVGSPRPAAELAMQRGMGLTVLHTSKGAA